MAIIDCVNGQPKMECPQLFHDKIILEVLRLVKLGYIRYTRLLFEYERNFWYKGDFFLYLTECFQIAILKCLHQVFWIKASPNEK